jgi:hypothetical protein
LTYFPGANCIAEVERVYFSVESGSLRSVYGDFRCILSRTARSMISGGCRYACPATRKSCRSRVESIGWSSNSNRNVKGSLELHWSASTCEWTGRRWWYRNECMAHRSISSRTGVSDCLAMCTLHLSRVISSGERALGGCVKFVSIQRISFSSHSPVTAAWNRPF